MVVHADHDQAGARRGARDDRQPREAGGPEHRLVDDHHVSGDVAQETDQVREVGGGARRRHARLALEQAPQRGPDPLVAGRDDDGDRWME